MSNTANIDYPDLAKYGTAASAAMICVGAAGTVLGSGVVSGWEASMLFDLEILGVLGIVVCPFLFGILLPLIE
ncbi:MULTISPECIES: hypothetical protein [Halobacterium]|uniref:Major facilitator superfamily (MFS) profile domain-containing protein n=4 Tax=Halobacterium salinarum TaxID=2242 RepID=Q9HN99_HALSA|nr:MULTISPECIES: hypothetical protein [Halobacterium]AAG20322.1 hypothetical protein VNG_2187H [Halobacterium salinarum NRC-1]MBB6089340.1 hypothetical protein [Halobacterium salinarum]MCF2166391.1 hypothetical protein [Halobacterium salinarum]MCF2167290.1 hypothetical protein [Halobacterium salinarum]MCF2208485.1 hypothetical protein [Halobacterium salinarum]